MVNVIHKCVSVIVLVSFFSLLPGNIIARPEHFAARNASEYFIENKGQIKDQFGKYRTDIDYKLPAGALNLFVGAGQIHYQWNTPVNKNTKGQEHIPDPYIATYRLDVTLDGANTAVKPVAEEAGTGTERFYLPGLDGVTAQSYKKVTYRNIYNLVDWVLYMNDGKLKYDFIVHPGGNINDIRIRYSGATKMTVGNGDVVITTPSGTITEKAPYTYYALSNQEIKSSYKLEGNTISFSVDEHEGPVVIDPSLEWASYMGGTGNDFAYGLAVDTFQNVYMVGTTASTSNIATTGAHQDTLAGDIDGYVIKFTPGGVRIWSTYYGGTKKDIISSVAINGENDIFFSGVTDSSYTLATTGSHQPNHGGGGSDGFLVKMNAGGQRIWATYYGGAGDEKDVDQYQSYVTCDLNNNVYMVGKTQSDTGIATTGTAQPTRNSLFDGYIVKFNKNGVRQWGSYYGGTYDDFFTNVTTDPNSTVYVFGQFKSDSMGTAGTYAQYWKNFSSVTNNNQRPSDAIIVKFNPSNGQRIWASYYGGEVNEESKGIAIGDSSNVYICGATTSTLNIATSGTEQQSIGSAYFDAFLAKFDSTGQRLWGTYFGGSSTDYGGNLVLDEAGNPNFTGNTASSSGIAVSGAHQTSLGSSGQFDGFLAIFNKSGNRLWATYYGGSDNDYGYGISTSSLGHVYICGNTASSNAIAFSGSQNTLGGSNDGFIAKFTPDTSVFVFQPFTQTVHCAEDSFVLDYGTTSPFLSGNVFTVQLSNSTGSFASPVNIGSKAGTNVGTIKCGIPASMSGTGFRIRIIATVPIDTSYDNGNDITIKPRPVKPVATTNTPVCSNDTLHLNTTSSGSGVSYTWTGPGSFIVYGQNVIRTNMSSSHTGAYIVTATLNGCTRADTTSATIIQAAPKPVAANNGPLCAGDNLALTGSNISVGTLNWAGPAGFSSTIQNPTKTNITTANAGNYILTITYNGCPSRDTTAVVIGEKPAPVTGNSNSPVCASDTLWLHAITSTPGVVYNWQGPGGYNSTTFQNYNPRTSLQPAYSGDYVVTADLAGCSVKDTISVTILQAPAKPVATANTPLCSGEDLHLGGNNISAGAQASWTGPGGYNPMGANQTRNNIQVAQAGTYILKSQLSNGCVQRDTVQVAVTQSTVLNISASVDLGTVVCPTSDVTFKVSPSQPISANFSWTGPGGWNSTDTMPQRLNVQYNDSGYYRVRVVLGGCAVGNDSFFLRVVDTISPPVLTTNSPVCEGDTLKLLSTHPGGNTPRSWVTPAGTIPVPGPQNITIFSSSSSDGGLYVVTAEAGGCKASDTAFVIVKPKPAPPTSGSNSPLCEGATLGLKSNSSASGITYSWTGPSGFNSTLQNPSISNLVPSVHAGTYSARTVLNGCLSDAANTVVVIEDNPKPKIATNSPVCEEGIITMSVNNMPGETYIWSGDKSTFNGSGPSASINKAKPDDQGMYRVRATSSATGCVGTDSAHIDIIPLPGKMSLSYDDPLCEGKKLDLKIDDTSTGSVGYAWRGPNGFTFFEKSAFINTVALADSGLYYVVASRLGCSRMDSIQVHIKPTPETPKISSNSPLSVGDDLKLMLENPVPGTSFNWKGPNSFGSRVQNPVLYKVNTSASGAYTLQVTYDGCSSSAITVVIVENGEAKHEELVLFPNPNKGTFTVRAILNSDQLMPLEVVSILGTVVYSDIVQSKNLKMEQKIEIDGGLSSGVYIFRIMMSGESREIPFSIVR